MKVLVALTFLAFASQSLAAPVGDQYADLINDVLIYAKQLLTAHDPMTLPDVKEQHIQDQNVDIVVSQTNTQLSKASTFTVQKVTTDPKTLTADVAVNIPEFVQSGQYEIQGTAYGRKVSGAGDIKVSLTGFAQEVQVTFDNPDTSLQITSLGLTYDLKAINVDITGLSIEGMTPAEVKVFVTKTFTNLILNNKQQVEQTTSAALQARLNPLLSGKTLAEVAAWVKSLIHQ